MRTVKLVIYVETELPAATIKSAATAPITMLLGRKEKIVYVGTGVTGEGEKIT